MPTHYRLITLGLLLLLGAGAPGCVLVPVGRIMETQEKEAYARYRIQAERLNLEREKAGLRPQEIMPYETWTTGKKK